jgi:hypothetical protein
MKPLIQHLGIASFREDFILAFSPFHPKQTRFQTRIIRFIASGILFHTLWPFWVF